MEINCTFVTLINNKLMGISAKFNVKYHKDAWDFLQRIDIKVRQKIADNVEKARHSLDPKLFKKLTGDVWEFRTLYGGKQYRLLAFWDKSNNADTLVITTHGFIKKTSKVPQKEIDKTVKIMQEYHKQQ